MNKMRDSMPVVFAVLAGIFLLMIIFEWGGQGRIFNSGGDAETLGTVDGYKITKKMWEQSLQVTTEQIKSQNKRTDLTEEMQTQAEQQAWERCVQQAIINQSVDRMHFTVTDQDVRDMMLENPPTFLRRGFTDSVGKFHSTEYVQWLRDPKNDSLVRLVESDVREQIKYQKWQESMASYVQVTDAELKERFSNENAKATIDVLKVMPGPAEIQQAMAQTTDADIQKYYDAHKWQYKVPEQRKMKFVPFPIQSSPRDTAKSMEAAQAVKRRLEQVPANQLDSAAKELLADYAPEADPAKAGGVQPIAPSDAMSGGLATAKPGDVVIATIGNKLSVVRVVNVSDTGLPLVHARHIFIQAKPPAGFDSAMQAAQRIYAQLKAGGNFEELAHNNSSDFRTAARGGDMGWLALPQFPPDINPLVDKAAINEIVGPARSGAGVDIIQVLGKAHRSVAGVVIPIDIKPSSQTTSMLMQQASAFREQASKNGFDEAAKAAGYRVIADAPPVSKKGAPIFSSADFVSWVFDAKKGDVSSPFKLTQIHAVIVAQVTDIIEAGPRPLEEVKDQIKQTIVKKKAVDLVVAKAQKARAAVGTSGDLAAGAQAIGDTSRPIEVSLGPAESVNGLPTGEYYVNNAAYSMKPGQVSDVIKGENGCYIIKLIDLKPATDQALSAQRQTLLGSLLQEKRQRFLMTWLDNRKASAVIADFRQRH